MTAKFSQARKNAFLAALRQTGNQTLAAERAKVSRSWVTLHRSSDPEFRRLSDAAVEEAKAALRQAQGERGGDKPPSGWGFLDGAELVVRGTGGSGGGKRVQIARARLKEWSPRVEERFLATLAATCNVKAACAAVGLTAASAYGHRKRWAAFERKWDAAVEDGYVRLEMGLIEAAGNFFSDEELPDAEPMITGITADHAIHLLHMHKHQVHGLGKRPGLLARWPDIEDVRAEILRKVAAMERHDPRQLERDREEWALRRGSGQPTRRPSSVQVRAAPRRARGGSG
jgi:hypothetical protein